MLKTIKKKLQNIYEALFKTCDSCGVCPVEKRPYPDHPFEISVCDKCWQEFWKIDQYYKNFWQGKENKE